MADKDEKKKLLHMLQTLLDDAKRECQEDRKEDEKDFDLYLGKETTKRSKHKGNTKTNLLFSQIETMKPILTTNIPTAELRPVVESDAWDEIAEEMSNVINRVLRRNDARTRFLELVSNGLYYGMGWFKVLWNPELFSGYGDIEITVPNTRSIYPEPGKDDLRAVNYLFEVTQVSQLTLLRKYPDRKADIVELFAKERAKGEVKPGTGKEVGRGKVATAPGAAASTSTERYYEAPIGGAEKLTDTVDLVEAWFHDDEMVEEEIEIQGKDGAKTKKTRMTQKYPHGRVILFSKNVVFEDRINPFPGIPYIPYYNYRIIGRPGGMSELRMLAPIQRQYKKRADQIFDFMAFNAGPIRFYDDRSGLDPDIITTAPNQWLHVHDVNGIKTEPPPPLHSAAFESLETERRNMETVSGVREITQGTVPGDIRSGAAIEALQEAADIRLRGKSGEMESTSYQLVRFIINLVVHYYKHGTHFRVDSDLEGADEFKVWQDKKLSADFFDIEIRAGVNLPRSRIAQQQFMQWMYDRNIVDELYVVNQSKLENKERLIERMKPIWDTRREALENPPAPGGQPPEGVQQ